MGDSTASTGANALARGARGARGARKRGLAAVALDLAGVVSLSESAAVASDVVVRAGDARVLGLALETALRTGGLAAGADDEGCGDFSRGFAARAKVVEDAPAASSAERARFGAGGSAPETALLLRLGALSSVVGSAAAAANTVWRADKGVGNCSGNVPARKTMRSSSTR